MMGKFDIDLSEMVEGSLISKKSITDDLFVPLNLGGDNYIGADNIREEGLDRRSFEDLKNVHFNVGENVNSTGFNHEIRPLTAPGMGFVQHGLRNVSGPHPSGDGTAPRVTFRWEPESDSYAIARCSFQFRQKRYHPRVGTYTPEGGDSLLTAEDDGWDFGLWVSPKYGDGIFAPSDRVTRPNPDGGVFPYQRVSLCPAFSLFAHFGGSIDPDGERDEEDNGPMRYRFDRTSGMSQSFHMFAVFAVSGANSPDLVSESSDWVYRLDEPCHVAVDLVWRSKYGFYSYFDPFGIRRVNNAEISGLNMNVVKYKR